MLLTLPVLVTRALEPASNLQLAGICLDLPKHTAMRSNTFLGANTTMQL